MPLAQRLPQSLGTWLALGFLTLSLGTGIDIAVSGRYPGLLGGY